MMKNKITGFITNGVIIIILGLLHSSLALSEDGFGRVFSDFSNSNFYKIHNGLDELPFIPGQTSVHSLESFSAFWFFYFGLILIPFGLLIHSVERSKKQLPLYFTVSYLLFILIGVYMIPNSGMTYFMLPHAIYMMIINLLKSRKKIVAL